MHSELLYISIISDSLQIVLKSGVTEGFRLNSHHKMKLLFELAVPHVPE